jgi:hypothetical protein
MEEAKKYKLDLLLHAAEKVDEFSPRCGECQALQPKIMEMVRELGIITQVPGRQALKKHTRAVNEVVAHLQKGHKVVSKGHYMGVGIGIGMVIGGALGGGLGSMIDFPAIGTIVGIALGIAIGIYLDKKAQREGRVIKG